MANGRQRAAQNLQAFNLWVASKTDYDYRQMAIRGVLSRVEIARECDFGKSALTQNPDIKEALRKLEDELRERHVLPPVAVAAEKPDVLRLRPSHRQSPECNPERLQHLEQENASLRAIRDDLTQRLSRSEELREELAQRLSRYEVIHQALVTTGRTPR